MNRYVIALLSVLGFALNSFGDVVIYDSHGFETPTFVAGQSVVGQDDWSAAAGTPNSFAVQTATVASGSQAVQANGGGANSGYAYPDLLYFPADNERIRIQLDIARTLSATVADSSPVYAVEIFDQNVDRTSRFGLQLPTDTSAVRNFISVPVPVEVNPTGNMSMYYGANVPQSQFEHFDFQLDYETKTVSLTVDGVRLASQVPFVSSDSFVLGGVALQVGTLPASADSGYFDNFLVTAQLKGDYNHDGVVDAADYVVWRDAPNPADPYAADGNGDGVINSADYDVWRSNFGNTPPAEGSGLKGGAAVPEPAPMLLALMGLGAILVGGRRGVMGPWS